MINKVNLKDIEYEKAIDELGFCLIPLLNEEQMLALKKLYETCNPPKNPASIAVGNYYFDLQTNQLIAEVISPALHSRFSNFDYFIGGFSVSTTSFQDKLTLTRDWCLTDEEKDASLNIWIPFNISYSANGGIVVIPGSHQFSKSFRSGSFGSNILDVSTTTRPFIVDVIIPPLSALCYEGSLLHGHYPNQTTQKQIGVLVSLVPKHAPTYYFHVNQGRAEKYSINVEQFIESLPCLLNGEAPKNFEHVEKISLPIENQIAISDNSLLQSIQKKFWGNEKYFHSNQFHLLKDLELRKQMYEKGYVILDFIDDVTVSLLMQTYVSRFATPVTNTGRFTTMENTSPETRLEIHKFILEKIKKSLDLYFADYVVPIASYFIKYAQSKGDLEWHTDASLLLNAHIEPHYAIWCPLIEVDAQNGALCVVDETHKLPHRIFLNGITWAYQPLADDFEKSGRAIALKPGQAVLFDIRLVHNATPNISNQDRICFSLRMTHKKTLYYHFEADAQNGNSIKVYNEKQNIYLQEVWNTPLMVPKEVDYIGEISNQDSVEIA